MNTLRLVIYLLLLNVIFQSCNQEDAFDCVKSTGPVQKEERTLTSFRTLVLRDNIDLVLDTVFSATASLEAGKNLLPKITLQQSGDTLFISNKNTCNWVRSAKHPISVTLNLPSEDVSIIHEGYGTITSKGMLKVKNLNFFSINAGGNINIQTQSDALSLYSNSHSLIEVEGTVNNAFMWINKGIGRIHAENLQSQQCTVKQEGSNEIRVFPIQELTVEILQSGNVAYYNEPAKITSTITGRGKLVNR